MPYQAEAIALLAIWREILEQLQTVPPESAEAVRLLDEWALLRTEYERLVELAVKHHRPAPPPWPED